MDRIKQKFSVEFQYDVVFTKNAFHKDNADLVEILDKEYIGLRKKVAFVIDSEVDKFHPKLKDQIKEYFNQHQDRYELCVPLMVVEGGESVKNSKKPLDSVLSLINDYNIDRQSFLIAIGGGAVLDMVGFAASIGHRGIRHIRMPSTVLSQNDSGVGVKNGINSFGKKNFLGTFQPPIAVVNDFSFLSTLSERDWRAGIAEAVKVALVKDKDFFHWINKHNADLRNRSLDHMATLIYQCAKYHMAHISTAGDPFEMGSSRPLDFGHWSAHKLEQMSDYQIKHGEAVAIGIALDVWYSNLAGLLDEDSARSIVECIQQLGFDIFHPLLLSQDKKSCNPTLIEGLEEFRQHLGGQLTIMLLKSIGEGIEVHEMEKGIIEKAVLKLVS